MGTLFSEKYVAKKKGLQKITQTQRQSYGKGGWPAPPPHPLPQALFFYLRNPLVDGKLTFNLEKLAGPEEITEFLVWIPSSWIYGPDNGAGAFQ